MTIYSAESREDEITSNWLARATDRYSGNLSPQVSDTVNRVKLIRAGRNIAELKTASTTAQNLMGHRPKERYAHIRHRSHAVNSQHCPGNRSARLQLHCDIGRL